MSRWRITPQGVEDVLLKVSAVAQTLSGAVDGLPAKAESALAATGNSPVIGDALVGFFEHHRPTLEAVGNRIDSSVNGALLATQAYLAGDEEMAAQHQEAAASVAGTGAARPGGGMQAR